MKTHYIRSTETEANLWAGGFTYPYFLYPPHSSYANRDFIFRISSATIEQTPSVFTHFEGYTRYLLMLDNDLNISINGENQHFEKQQIFLFNSADQVISTSKGTDFNWMVREDITQHQIQVTAGIHSCNSSFVLLFALEDVRIEVQQKSYSLEKHSCFIIENTYLDLVDLFFETPLVFMTLDI